MAPRDNESPLFDDEDGPDLASPGEGFELYRHKDADKMTTKGWHGYYWARRTEEATTSSAACHPLWGSTRCTGVSFLRKDSSSITR